MRYRGYRGLICATITFDEEASVVRAAGGDVVFNHYTEAGVGFAERAWEVMHPEQEPVEVAVSN